MTIQIDTKEKQRAITKIIQTFDDRGVKHISSKLYVGDYMNLKNPMIIVDRKQNLRELASNVSYRDRKRFISEIKRANDVGIKLIFLVEHGGAIQTLKDVQNWYNPQLQVTPMAMSGDRVYKHLSMLQKTYGVEFRFCKKCDTGKRILELLS